MFCAIFLLLLLAPVASLEIVCGDYHNCVFERGQEAMKCWGRNYEGQLGYGDNNNRGDGADEMGSNLPLLNIGTGFTVEEMSLGVLHSCAMSDARAMKCFGSNAYSQLGFDGVTTTGDALPFLEFGVDFNLSKIAAGYHHTCALSTDAALKCFGRNSVGQCGAGTNARTISGPPSQITAIDFGTNFTAADVHTFFDHVCVLSQQQTVKCFGGNYFGQLGYGDITNRGETPESMGDGLPIVDLGSDFIVAAISTGAFHTCALSTTKTVKCWGDNGDGACGTPYSTETGDNLPVLEFGAGFVPMQLTLGGYHTCILSETVTLICFGRNDYGQLGIGSYFLTDTRALSTLTGIDLGTNFVPRQVAGGDSHTCAVSTGDDIKCFGYNFFGQLGLGHTNNTGDGPNEMGDNLPFVDVAWPSAAPTSAPTTASPTTSSPTTDVPTTTAPTTASPTTASPTTASPTTASPTTASPTTASPTTASPTTASPTTASPTTTSPLSTTTSTEITVFSRNLTCDNISSIVPFAIANATQLQIAINVTSSECEHFGNVTFLLTVPSDVPLWSNTTFIDIYVTQVILQKFPDVLVTVVVVEVVDDDVDDDDVDDDDAVDGEDSMVALLAGIGAAVLCACLVLAAAMCVYMRRKPPVTVVNNNTVIHNNTTINAQSYVENHGSHAQIKMTATALDSKQSVSSPPKKANAEADAAN